MRTNRATLRDDDIPAEVITAWKGVSENFLNKVSSKEISEGKLDIVFQMWDTICGIMELNSIQIAEGWFKKYTNDATEARRRLKNLASGMSDSEFEALIG